MKTSQGLNVFERLERSLSALERLLGVSLTLIDNAGSLHDAEGRPLFPPARQSHQRNRICKLGFCAKCVERCRYENLKEAENPQSKEYFFHRCWKGVMEAVVPLRSGDFCVGLLYAGAWRVPGEASPASSELLPPEAVREYAALDEFDPERARVVACALESVGKGIVSGIEGFMSHGGGLHDRRRIVREYIFKRSAKSPSLPELAKRLGLSPSRTSHLVKELFGRCFEELVLEERMNRAKSLLASTDLPVGRIAEIAGFSDQCCFSKTFRRREGLPPGGYRKEQEK